MATQLDDRQVVNRSALSALGNTANLTLDVIMGDINALFAAATYIPTGSVLMTRDANANTQANNFLEGFATTATAAGTTTLTVASKAFQQFTGTSTQTVVLPNATTLTLGQSFTIANRSTGNVTVQNATPSTLQTMTANSQAVFTVTSIATSAGTWDIAYTITGPNPFLQTQVTTDSTTTGSAATLLTGDISYGTVRLTNASLVSVSGIPVGASGQQIIVENQTGNTITINNNDAGATAANRILTGTSGAVTMAANASFEFVYDTTAARWMLVGGTGSGSGSGGGKNYLSVYTASTSSGVPNTGNGNFESGSTTGWSLAHTSLSSLIPNSVATAGTPFSASAGGSAASGNLSITTVTAGTQIAGTYSGSLASSAASVAGDLLISSAFFIDKEDQAKVMQIKLYYQVATAGGLNFSGSSANGFAVYIYDVTNGAWIQPAGVYNFTQSSGTGYLTATFQTTSNSTQYQIALVNINASTGPYTMYLDDISVGPQIAPTGPAMTDWIPYSPTFANISGGSTGTALYHYRRVGDTLEVNGYLYAAGTGIGISGNVSFSIPTGLTIDSTKMSITEGSAGAAELLANGLWRVPMTVQATSSTSFSFTANAATTSYTAGGNYLSNLYPTTSTTYWVTGSILTWNASFPIVGWSSNTAMSSDTDTRVVAASANNPSATITGTPSVITWGTVLDDTHGVMGTTTYTVPVSGRYEVTGNLLIATTSTLGTGFIARAYLYKNGSATGRQSTCYIVGTSGYQPITMSFGEIVCNSGDTLQIYVDSNASTPNFSGLTTQNQVSFKRLSGPSVIAATESVNASYQNTAGTIIGTSATTVPFPTKYYDSHNAWNTTNANAYTCPVSGKYRISVNLVMAGVTLTTSQAFIGQVNQAGSVSVTKYLTNTPGNGATSVQYSTSGSATFNCAAGDTLIIQATCGVSSGLNTSVGINRFEIERVGN